MNLSKESIQKLMGYGITIQKNCKESCFEFQIMTSPLFKDTLILRWLEIDISDIERPIQCYRYRCFDLDGTSQNCSIPYTHAQEANAFFKSLEAHYKLDFATE